jgi:DNA repair protein RadC
MGSKHYNTQVKVAIAQVREATGPQMTSGKGFADMFSDIVDMAQEAFFVVTMDQKHKVIDKRMVTLGTLTASLVHPREVFRPALLDSAAAVAFVHNHPSGDPTPSGEDNALTDRLREAGKILGIRVLDHVIVARNGYTSYVDAGLM